MRIPKTLLLFISLLNLFSCAGRNARLTPVPSEVSASLRHQLVEILKARDREIKSVSGFAAVRYGTKVLGRRNEMIVLIKRPYSLRMEGFSVLGMAEQTIVLANGSLTLYWPSKNSYFKGLASVDVMERYLKISLGPEASIQILSGAIPVGEESEYVLYSLKGSRELSLKGPTDEVVFAPRGQGFVPLRYTAYDTENDKKYQVDYSDKLLVQFFDPSLKVEIDYHDVERNGSLDEKLFQLEIPNDALPIGD